MQHQTIIGIDIGGTKCAVSIGRTDGTILARKAVPTESDRRTPQEVLEILAAVARELLVSTGEAGRPSGAGISCCARRFHQARRIMRLEFRFRPDHPPITPNTPAMTYLSQPVFRRR